MFVIVQKIFVIFEKFCRFLKILMTEKFYFGIFPGNRLVSRGSKNVIFGRKIRKILIIFVKRQGNRLLC